MQRFLSAWNRLLLCVGVAGAVLTITGAVQGWWPKSSPDGRWAVGGLLGLLVVLGLAYSWQEYRYARKARYAEALNVLNQILEELGTVGLSGLATSKEVLDVAQRSIDRLAHAFSLITGTQCSVCIKALESTADFAHLPTDATTRPYVHTLCRDAASRDREFGPAPEERTIYEMEQPGGFKHFIDQNTDFEQIFTRTGTPKRFFFSNNLPALRGYKNSSFHYYGEPADGWASRRNLIWPLPYKSTIVVPVSRRSLHLDRGYDLKGFLCVDSRSRNVFADRYDLDIMQCIGRTLVPLLERYRAVSEEDVPF